LIFLEMNDCAYRMGGPSSALKAEEVSKVGAIAREAIRSFLSTLTRFSKLAPTDLQFLVSGSFNCGS
jgi:hypothetical protein